MKFKLALAAGALAALSASLAQADINVGVSTSLTGPGASIGIPSRNALDFWPTEIAGQKIVLHVLDDAGDPTTATKNAWRFVADKADVIVGAANTPATIAIAKVANENQTVQLSPSPAELPQGADRWTFRVVMPASYYIEGFLEHMKKSGVKKLAFFGLSDAYGESHLQALKQQAAKAGIKIVAIERFSRSDNSVSGQALSIVASKPDAVLVIAVGGGAALPQKALRSRGYAGSIYHSAATVSPDFLRLAGKDAVGAIVISGPEQVPEQLPASHAGKKIATDFVTRYEAKYGSGSRTQFSANVYDLSLALAQAIPVALKKGKPGTQEFRTGLRDALETQGPTPVTKGMLHYTPEDHWGFGPDARVMLTPQGGGWKLLP